MRTHPWEVLLLSLALLSTACASLAPTSSRGRGLRDVTCEAQVPAQSAPQARQALLVAVLDVSGSIRRGSAELSRLKGSQSAIAGKAAGLFLRYVEYGEHHLRWMEGELSTVSRLSTTAMEMEDPEMQLALLRLAGPRLEAAMMGSLLLEAWVDFLNLVDIVLRECPTCGKETLLRRMDGLKRMLEPAMTALSSLEAERMEAAAEDLPALMGHLSSEFAATQESMRVTLENFEKVLLLKEAIDTITMLSAMRLSLPRLPPATPVTLGVGLVAGSNGVMMGTQVVVSAEWVEMMRQLVRAGVLSASVVSAAVRIHAGQVLMAQSNDELPRGVREALGDSPEVRGMRSTGKAGAGMAEPPRHHVLPQEHREWFEQRGFTGDMSIDQFCVRMERASHEAIHGGGNWRLGRQWPGEWNQMIMEALYKAETRAGRMLTRKEVLDIVAERMKFYKVPMEFIRWRGP